LRAAELAQIAEVLVTQSLPGCAYWVESGGEDGESLRGGRFRRITFACSPIEVAPILREKLFAGKTSVVMTSATLALNSPSLREGGNVPGTHDAPYVLSTSPADHRPGAERQATQNADFSHIKSRLGCDGADTLRLGSPFDHSAQMELYIETSLPRPEGGRPR